MDLNLISIFASAIAALGANVYFMRRIDNRLDQDDKRFRELEKEVTELTTKHNLIHKDD